MPYWWVHDIDSAGIFEEKKFVVRFVGVCIERASRLEKTFAALTKQVLILLGSEDNELVIMKIFLIF